MGFNTTAVILNDHLGSIERDPDIGKKIVSGVLGLSIKRPQLIDGGSITLVETHHADGYVPVLVGRNQGLPIDAVVSWSHEQDAAEKELLKKLAEKHGYNLHRKRGR